MTNFTQLLMVTLGSARLLNYDLHNNHERFLTQFNAPYQPDSIVFYGNHHAAPELDCNELMSKDIYHRVVDHVDSLSLMITMGDYEAIVQSYPSIANAFYNSWEQLQPFLNKFREDIQILKDHEMEHNDGEMADLLRHYSILGLKQMVHHFPAQIPRRLSVENLRALRSDMLQLGGTADLFDAVASLIDCVTVHRFDPPMQGQSGYPVNDNQDTHQSQSYATMINDITVLTEDAKLKDIFHPLGSAASPNDLSDVYFPLQWYLGGPPEQPYGANFIRAWKVMTNREDLTGLDSNAFPRSSDGQLDFNIAIVDMGCGVHDDLLYDASNPICQQDNTKVGTTGDEGNDVLDLDQLSKKESEGDRVGEETKTTWGASYCDQPHLVNEGHETLTESYFLDPSNHGTSTASLIGAGWNDKNGIAGLCPFCSVKCIKISSNENDKASVNMSGIFRSLEFLAAFSDRYLISNHSYGGFFLDAKELEGHRRLSELGHLAVVAAGNYGCDIDPLADAYGAFNGQMSLKPATDVQAQGNECKSGDALATMPMMPAAAQFNTKMNVGAINITGGLSKFSNWGGKSVSIFAPGETIVSLKARGAKASKSRNDEIAIQHGTSFATPISAAGAALVWRQLEQFCHQPTAQMVIEILKETVTPVSTIADKAQSGGTLNVYEALKSIPNRC